MGYNNGTDTVIGYLDSKKGESSAQLSVIGYVTPEKMFIKDSSEFLPYGKVFCPSFFAINTIPDSIKNSKTIIEFSCLESKHDVADTHKDIYSVDTHKSINVLCRILVVPWNENSIGLSEKNFNDFLSIGDSWQAYPFNPETGTLYEDVRFAEGRLFPVRGKEIAGFSIIGKNIVRLTLHDLPYIEYWFSSEVQEILNGEPRHSIDFMTIPQLKGWIKDKLKAHASLGQETIQHISSLINSLPVDAGELDQVRLKRANSYLKNLDFIDKDLCSLISPGKSSIGDEFRNQIESLKEEFIKDWENELEEDFKIKKDEFEESLKALKKEASDMEQNILHLEIDKKKLEDEIEKLKAITKSHRDEITLLEENKALIVSTLKVLATNNSYTQASKAPSTSDRGLKSKIFTIGNRDKVFESSQDDLEENLVRLLRKHAGVSNELSQSIVNTLKQRASFIPSVSWVYALANLLGGCKIMHLTIEYDWLHFSDFCEHGLLEFWEMAHHEPSKIFILVLQNINIVPSECSMLPLIEVLSGMRPTLEGTQYGVPSNLYCMATVCSPTGEHAMGIPLRKELFQFWGASWRNDSNGSIDHHSLMKIDVGVPQKLLEEAVFGFITHDMQAECDSIKESYYVG